MIIIKMIIIIRRKRIAVIVIKCYKLSFRSSEVKLSFTVFDMSFVGLYFIVSKQ